jgi:homeobox protein cut-like
LSRVTILESQITELESEASRLIRSLDVQKELLETERAESGKRIEALEKDQAEKDKEIESCKERLKQFGDYDELRRELEIMKVGLVSRPIISYLGRTSS